jgi:hypothetical protein
MEVLLTSPKPFPFLFSATTPNSSLSVFKNFIIQQIFRSAEHYFTGYDAATHCLPQWQSPYHMHKQVEAELTVQPVTKSKV